MIKLYIIGLVFLAALVIGLVFYIFLRRAYLRFSEWDERRRSRYWKPIIHQWLHHSSDELDNEFSSFISSKDQKIIIKLCIENINIKFLVEYFRRWFASFTTGKPIPVAIIITIP